MHFFPQETKWKNWGGETKENKKTLIPINAGDWCDIMVNITCDQRGMQVLFPRKKSIFIYYYLNGVRWTAFLHIGTLRSGIFNSWKVSEDVNRIISCKMVVAVSTFQIIIKKIFYDIGVITRVNSVNSPYWWSKPGTWSLPSVSHY